MENNNLKQLIISGILGDGHLGAGGDLHFSCKHSEYLNLKKELSGEFGSDIKRIDKNGYSQTEIFSFRCRRSSLGKTFHKLPLEEQVKDMDELGLALWLYDDGSLHKTNHFFNINSHSFSKNFQEKILIPILNKFNIFPKIMIERKSDGRVFNYLYVAKHKGVYDITRILRKCPVKCYSYKLIPDEEYLRWKSLNDVFGGYKINSKTLSKIMSVIVEHFEDYLSTLHITEGGFITPNKRAKLKVDQRTIYLQKDLY